MVYIETIERKIPWECSGTRCSGLARLGCPFSARRPGNKTSFWEGSSTHFLLSLLFNFTYSSYAKGRGVITDLPSSLHLPFLDFRVGFSVLFHLFLTSPCFSLFSRKRHFVAAYLPSSMASIDKVFLDKEGEKSGQAGKDALLRELFQNSALLISSSQQVPNPKGRLSSSPHRQYLSCLCLVHRPERPRLRRRLRFPGFLLRLRFASQPSHPAPFRHCERLIVPLYTPQIPPSPPSSFSWFL